MAINNQRCRLGKNYTGITGSKSVSGKCSADGDFCRLAGCIKWRKNTVSEDDVRLIRELRQQQGASLSEIANKIGCSESAVSRIANYDRRGLLLSGGANE